MVEFDVVVLAGGASSRFGGVDKAGLVLDGISLLDRVLTATAGASTTVVVGPVRKVVREVTWTLEDPPLGGPVAGLAAGLRFGRAPVVVVVSCDLPWLTEAEVLELVDGLGAHDGYGLRDSDGRTQRLAAAYHRQALQEAVDRIGDPRNQPVRKLVEALDLAWTAPTRAGDDVDTWSDFDEPPSQP